MRARIGTPRISAAGTSTSRSVAAIAIETFIGSGLPQTRGDGGGQPRGDVDAAAGDAALARQRDHAFGARVDRLVQRMAEAGERLSRCAIGSRDRRRGRVVGRAPASTRSRTLVEQGAAESAAPRMTVPQPSTPAATAPCSAAGSAA